jgi:hypothetical protein
VDTFPQNPDGSVEIIGALAIRAKTLLHLELFGPDLEQTLAELRDSLSSADRFKRAARLGLRLAKDHDCSDLAKQLGQEAFARVVVDRLEKVLTRWPRIECSFESYLWGWVKFTAMALMRIERRNHPLTLSLFFDDGNERIDDAQSKIAFDPTDVEPEVADPLAWVSDLSREAQHELVLDELHGRALIWAETDERRQVAFGLWASVFVSSFLEGDLKLALTRGEKLRMPKSFRRQLERDLNLSDKWLRGWQREFEGHLQPVLANLMSWHRTEKNFRSETPSGIPPHEASERRTRG